MLNYTFWGPPAETTHGPVHSSDGFCFHAKYLYPIFQLTGDNIEQ